MPMSPVNAAFLLAMAGCVPKYAQLSPMSPDDLKTPFPTRTIDVHGVQVAYIDEGPSNDQTPLVFVHGLSSYMGYWEEQLPHFARDRRVLALDLPGYGASGRPDAPYTPMWYSDLIVDWLDLLKVDKAIFVGHSMGGQISMTIALQHPEKVDRLVLAAPAGIERFDAGAARWMKEYWTEGRALEATEAELRATFTTLVFNRHDDGVERLLEERVRMTHTRAFQGTAVAVSRSVAGMLDQPVWQRLDRIKAPTLLIFGTEDHMIPNAAFTGGSTRDIAEQGRRAFKDCELVMIPGAGHTLQHDAPDAFNRAVDEFLHQR